MDARAIREAMAEGLEAGGVTVLSRIGQRRAFVDGERDYTLAELGMDSLAKMELCIAIEIGTGISMAPEEVDRYASLGAIVGEVVRRRGA